MATMVARERRVGATEPRPARPGRSPPGPRPNGRWAAIGGAPNYTPERLLPGRPRTRAAPRRIRPGDSGRSGDELQDHRERAAHASDGDEAEALIQGRGRVGGFDAQAQ